MSYITFLQTFDIYNPSVFKTQLNFLREPNLINISNFVERMNDYITSEIKFDQKKNDTWYDKIFSYAPRIIKNIFFYNSKHDLLKLSLIFLNEEIPNFKRRIY